MNRNNERHFNQIPEMKASRTRFNRDQTILTTFDSGKLIPFYVDEVLPGDTFNVNTSAIIRMTTPKYPVMDDAFIDFYYFYVPNRIIWDDFKRFMGEVDETPWMPTKEYKVPTIIVQGSKSAAPIEESILDYMGVPTKIKKDFEINALPIRAYIKIWNEFFRDENVENAATLKTGSEKEYYADDKNASVETTLKYAKTGGRCLPVNKFHDYFTSCLPYPQRGPEVTLPITGNAPVGMYKDQNLTEYGTVNGNQTIYFNQTLSGSANAPNIGNSNIEEYKGYSLVTGSSDPTSEVKDLAFMGADLSKVAAATINDLRKAVAVQQYYEALARGGSRYREQVQALWDVVISVSYTHLTPPTIYSV